MVKVILMDAEESSESLSIEFDNDQSMVNFICEDGTYQSVWIDQLVKALESLGVIAKGRRK